MPNIFRKLFQFKAGSLLLGHPVYWDTLYIDAQL